jgi:hypothetical protein
MVGDLDYVICRWRINLSTTWLAEKPMVRTVGCGPDENLYEFREERVSLNAWFKSFEAEAEFLQTQKESSIAVNRDTELSKWTRRGGLSCVAIVTSHHHSHVNKPQM